MRRPTRSAFALLAAGLALPLAAGCAHEPSYGRPVLHKVHVDGNQHFHGNEIKDRIALESSSWVPFAAKHYFDPGTLEVDKARIEAFYHAHGYFNARVAKAEVVKRNDGSVDVNLVVDEGPPTNVAAIDFHGLEPLPAKLRARVTRRLSFAVGDVFNHDKYLVARARIEERLRRAGYAWAKTSGEALVNRDRRTADIEFQVEPGPEVRFGELIIRGSPLVHQLRRRADISPGDRFDPDRLDATRGRFQATGLFSTVALTPVPRAGDPSIADVIVEVTPGKRNELKVGLGFGLENDRQSIYIPVQYTRSGFLGGLRTLRLRARPGYLFLPTVWSPQKSGPTLATDVTFTQPDLLLRDLKLKLVAGYDLGVDYAFDYQGPRGSAGLDYTLWHDRVAFSFSYNFQFLTFYSLTNATVFNDPNLARTFLGYTNPYYLSYLLEEASLDLRDRPLDPHKGAYAKLTVEEGVPLGGQFLYEKFEPELRGYVPLGRRVTLAGRAQFGWLYDQGSLASPITRRFYAGGADSHRGFGYDRLSPQVPGPSGTLPIPIGGNQLVLLQGELRTDLFRLSGNWLGLDLFLDAGDVPDHDRNIDFTQLHLATGGGLRYHTVIGTLRADVGIRLNRLSPFQPDGRENPDPGSRFAFHISIGEAF